ncbi:syndecan-4-like [Thunnus thynnus]|uniref:syndecan-4-like n=1 Tax=Thunnus thynnus TaxID=8237 RepID=UPI003527A119
MRISLTASLLVALGFMCPIHMLSPALTDFEGSGYDLDGSGSGDWSDQGEINNKDQSNNKDVRILGGGTKNTLQDSSDLTFDSTHWLAKDSGSGYVVVANSKSFLENKEILAGIVAGGVIGVMVAAVLGAILIYKWQKKDGGYIMGQQRASDDFH